RSGCLGLHARLGRGRRVGLRLEGLMGFGARRDLAFNRTLLARTVLTTRHLGSTRLGRLGRLGTVLHPVRQTADEAACVRRKLNALADLRAPLGGVVHSTVTGGRARILRSPMRTAAVLAIALATRGRFALGATSKRRQIGRAHV